MGQAVRPEFHAVLLHLANLLKREQIPRAQSPLLIPYVRSSDAIHHQEDKGRISILDHQRQKFLEKVLVRVIKGQQDMLWMNRICEPLCLRQGSVSSPTKPAHQTLKIARR